MIRINNSSAIFTEPKSARQLIDSIIPILIIAIKFMKQIVGSVQFYATRRGIRMLISDIVTVYGVAIHLFNFIGICK